MTIRGACGFMLIAGYNSGFYGAELRALSDARIEIDQWLQMPELHSSRRALP
jgi:hypothetical protein